jgi:hypothetical protein
LDEALNVDADAAQPACRKEYRLRRRLIWMLAAVVCSAADAQTLTKPPMSSNPVTSAEMTERLEKSAVRTRQSAPNGAARGSSVDFCWPSDLAEYRALQNQVLVLVSVVTQDKAELPLRRVYVNIDGKETELTRLSSQLSDVRKGSVTSSILGPWREDGFYLAPAGPMMSEGYLQADFAVRRNGFNLYKLPGTPPDFIKADSNPMPMADARPDAAALKAMLRREYRGFKLPESLR